MNPRYQLEKKLQSLNEQKQKKNYSHCLDMENIAIFKRKNTFPEFKSCYKRYMTHVVIVSGIDVQTLQIIIQIFWQRFPHNIGRIWVASKKQKKKIKLDTLLKVR